MSKAEEIKKYLEVKKLNVNEKNPIVKEQQEEAAEKSILNNGRWTLQISYDMWFPNMWHFDKCRLRRACAAYF